MARHRAVQLIICLLGLTIATPSFASLAAADTSVIVTGGFTTTDTGTFSVTLAARPDAGCGSATPGDGDFGSVSADAVGGASGVVSTILGLCLNYTDTEIARGPFTVQLSIPAFLLDANPVPSFYGSDDVSFEIPNRFLELTTVGAVTGGETGTGVGDLSAVQPDHVAAFDTGPLPIAQAASGSGVIAAKQEIGLTLNVPAGVFPGRYDATVSVDVVAAP